MTIHFCAKRFLHFIELTSFGTFSILQDLNHLLQRSVALRVELR